MVFKWENPVTSGAAYESLENAATKLRERPGTWARISERKNADAAAQVAYQIRNRRRAGFQHGTWEAKSKMVDKDTFAVYARFMGD